MGFKALVNKVRHNHLVMMVICWAIPLIVLVIAFYFFGLDNSYLFWFILLLCPILHSFLMKGTHHKPNTEENDEKID